MVKLIAFILRIRGLIKSNSSQSTAHRDGGISVFLDSPDKCMYSASNNATTLAHPLNSPIHYHEDIRHYTVSHWLCSSVLRQINGILQSKFSAECDPVLPLSIYSVLFFPSMSFNSCLRLLHHLPVTLSFPLTFLQLHFVEGSSCARCDHFDYPSSYYIYHVPFLFDSF
jgi:hypothetical protein